MKPAEDKDGFIQLWPTPMLRQQLPGHEAANKILSELILKREQEQHNLTTDYLASNFLADPHPAIKWLSQCIQVSVKQYMEKQGVSYETRWTLQGWPNVNHRGDYHGLHNHPHSYLSGTYYVCVPPQKSCSRNRSDLAPAEISFYDPRPQANMTAIRDDAQIEAEYSLLPEPGELLIWPAWLHHMVHPNSASDPRISISFNVVLQRASDHLPQQT